MMAKMNLSNDKTAAALFGLLAVELSVELINKGQGGLTQIMSLVFFALSMVFVWRSFYGMRIVNEDGSAKSGH